MTHNHILPHQVKMERQMDDLTLAQWLQVQHLTLLSQKPASTPTSICCILIKLEQLLCAKKALKEKLSQKLKTGHPFMSQIMSLKFFKSTIVDYKDTFHKNTSAVVAATTEANPCHLLCFK